MKLDDITANIGDYTKDSILVAKAEPVEGPRILVRAVDRAGLRHDGLVPHWVSVRRDVTGRVELERRLTAWKEALQQSERLLREEKIQLSGIAVIAQFASDFITITDLNFRILWANPVS